jgi:hypothetical protein
VLLDPEGLRLPVPKGGIALEPPFVLEIVLEPGGNAEFNPEA